MKRPVTLLSIIAATWLAAPVAMAGNDILKCVDAQGHVTLTDQPCEGGATTVRVSAYGGGTSSATSLEAPPPQRHLLPVADLRQASWQRPLVEHTAPLARDVATLKAAKRALLLMEAPRNGTSLAALQ